jgi:hypothetical protein
MNRLKRWFLRGIACGTALGAGLLIAQVALNTTYSTQPSSLPGGSLWYATDSPLFALFRSSGTNYSFRCCAFPVGLAPSAASWSWQSANGATVDQANGMIYLQKTASSGYFLNFRAIVVSAAPYTYTAGVVPALDQRIQVDNSCGIGFYDGSSNYATLTIQPQSSTSSAYTVSFRTWSSSSTLTSTIASAQMVPQTPIFLRIANNGTNVTGSYSYDKVHFINTGATTTMSVATSTAFPSGIGFAGVVIDANSSTSGTGYTSGCTFISWEQN